MQNESKGCTQTMFPSSNSNTSIKIDIALGKPSTSTERSNPSVSDVTLSSPKLSAPLFTKKAKTQGTAEKTELNHTATVNDVGKVKNIEEVKDAGKLSNAGDAKMVGEMHQVQPLRPKNPFSKPLNSQEKNTGEIDQVQLQRPSNPFLKSSVK